MKSSSVSEFILALFAELVRPMIVFVSFVAIALGSTYVIYPEILKRYLNQTIEGIIIYEQIVRSHSQPSADLLFVGDSSCLEGIDFKRLSSALNRSTVSLCSVAWLGPAGFARLIENYVKHGSEYRAIVMAIHPESALRDISWDAYVKYVAEDGPPPPNSIKERMHLAIHMGEQVLLRPLIRIPDAKRPAYSLYYGSVENARNSVRETGSLIDPTGALNYSSKAEFLQKANLRMHEPPNPCPYCAYYYDVPNKVFINSLASLRKVLVSIGRPVYLLITPLPDEYADKKVLAALLKMRHSILEELGLSDSSLINGPSVLPIADFSAATHLNRFGRELYTDELAKLLVRTQ